jgi:hypothetical protein
LSTALLARRGSTPTRSGGSHLSPRKGTGRCRWDLMGRGEVPRVHIDLESKDALVSVCLLVPLPKGNTMKKEVIRLIGSGLIGG